MVDKEFVLNKEKREKLISFVDQCGQKTFFFEIDPPSERLNELIFT